MKGITTKLYERHAIAFLLLCYFAIFMDTRLTTGTVGFMLTNYSIWFVRFLAAWTLIGAVYLLIRRAYPVTMAIASLPILAYVVMGGVFIFSHFDTAPIAAFAIHFGVYGVVLFLIALRIRAMAKGVHNDDSIANRPND